MERRDVGLDGVCLIAPEIHRDPRGFFLESYHRLKMADIGIDCEFVQDNHARSGRGVLRGLHYQIGRPQAKLVRVTRGRVFDVVVDLRRDSATFGRWFGTELDADSQLMLFAPVGCAHGYLVLSDVAEFQYKCSDFYAPDEERGVRWDDPDIAVAWPLGDLEPLLSDRDRRWPRLVDVPRDDLFGAAS